MSANEQAVDGTTGVVGEKRKQEEVVDAGDVESKKAKTTDDGESAPAAGTGTASDAPVESEIAKGKGKSTDTDAEPATETTEEVNEVSDEINPDNIIEGKRSRNKVDYKKLLEEEGGDEQDDGEEEADDEVTPEDLQEGESGEAGEEDEEDEEEDEAEEAE